MSCSRCGGPGFMKSPDYGRGAEYACYCKGGDTRWVDNSPEGRRASEASKAQSRANARAWAERMAAEAKESEGNADE